MKITSYFKQINEEIKKVSWPTKEETKNNTILVIGISIGMAAFLGALDYAFSIAFEFLINK